MPFATSGFIITPKRGVCEIGSSPDDKTDALYRVAYQALPQVRFQRIDGSLHYVMLDQPDAFAAEFAKFLAR